LQGFSFFAKRRWVIDFFYTAIWMIMHRVLNFTCCGIFGRAR
jgi:hypothetical protein